MGMLGNLQAFPSSGHHRIQPYISHTSGPWSYECISKHSRKTIYGMYRKAGKKGRRRDLFIDIDPGIDLPIGGDTRYSEATSSEGRRWSFETPTYRATFI